MKITYDHFHNSIPQALRERIGQVAKIAYDDLISESYELGGECYACPNINDIYGYNPGGFIPFQHGGYEVTELYRHDTDPSYHLTAGQTDSAIAHEKHLYDCYASDRAEELKENGINTESDDFDTQSYVIPEALENDFYDYESEFWEPALLRFRIFVSKPDNDIWDEKEGPRTIELSLSLAYSDAPYYREKYDDDTIATLSLTLDEFNENKPENIIKRFKEIIQNNLKKGI